MLIRVGCCGAMVTHCVCPHSNLQELLCTPKARLCQKPVWSWSSTRSYGSWGHSEPRGLWGKGRGWMKQWWKRVEQGSCWKPGTELRAPYRPSPSLHGRVGLSPSLFLAMANPSPLPHSALHPCSCFTNRALTLTVRTTAVYGCKNGTTVNAGSAKIFLKKNNLI